MARSLSPAPLPLAATVAAITERQHQARAGERTATHCLDQPTSASDMTTEPEEVAPQNLPMLPAEQQRSNIATHLMAKGTPGVVVVFTVGALGGALGVKLDSAAAAEAATDDTVGAADTAGEEGTPDAREAGAVAHDTRQRTRKHAARGGGGRERASANNTKRSGRSWRPRSRGY